MVKMNYNNPITFRMMFDDGCYSIFKHNEKTINHGKKYRTAVGKVTTYLVNKNDCASKIFTTIWKQNGVYVIRFREVINGTVLRGYQEKVLEDFFYTSEGLYIPHDNMDVIRLIFIKNGMQFYKNYPHAKNSRVYIINAKLSVI